MGEKEKDSYLINKIEEMKNRLGEYHANMLMELERQKLMEFLIVFGSDYEELRALDYYELVLLAKPLVKDLYFDLFKVVGNPILEEWEEDGEDDL